MGRKMPLIELGLQIKNELAKKNMTQMELANATGINYRVIHDVMTGRNRSDKNIKAIKEELGLDEVAIGEIHGEGGEACRTSKNSSAMS